MGPEVEEDEYEGGGEFMGADFDDVPTEVLLLVSDVDLVVEALSHLHPREGEGVGGEEEVVEEEEEDYEDYCDIP